MKSNRIDFSSSVINRSTSFIPRYLEFHKQQKGLIEKYPKMIKEEVKRYTTSMCSFFNAAEQGCKVNEMIIHLSILTQEGLGSSLPGSNDVKRLKPFA